MTRLFFVAVGALVLGVLVLFFLHKPSKPPMNPEIVLTTGNYGKILTNCQVWSPDSQWIVYDTRSDPAGDRFDGTRIEAVNITTREVRVLYESQNGAHCGVATWHPSKMKVAFILGPEAPTADWSYGPSRRHGVVVDFDPPNTARNLDARNLVEPYTPGALRGGTHVHMWNPLGNRLSMTYEDQVLTAPATGKAINREPNRRTVAVSIPERPVTVPTTHPRNHSGDAFTVVITRTVPQPVPGSDEIARAFEEAWIGTNGYLRTDGSRQKYALAFQGEVRTTSGEPLNEVFVVDLPEDLTRAGTEPLSGTPLTMPAPPRGVTQRRLTFTEKRLFPGIQGPRHWLRSSPDGAQIGYLAKDDAGDVQFWTVSPNGGSPRQVTNTILPVQSSFTWHPDGQRVVFVMDNSICITTVATGKTYHLTVQEPDAQAPRPEACVVSPDGKYVAYTRPQVINDVAVNQICIVPVRPLTTNQSNTRELANDRP